MQTSSGKVKLFFEPSRGKVAYYTVSVSPFDDPDNILAIQTITQQPFSAIIDDRLIIPGNKYIANFRAYNSEIEYNQNTVIFIMASPDRPILEKIIAEGSFIEVQWDTAKDVDHFEISVINKKTGDVIYEDLNYRQYSQKFQGLELNTEYEINIASNVKGINSLPLTETVLTKSFSSVSGGLAAGQLLSEVNNDNNKKSQDSYENSSLQDNYLLYQTNDDTFCIDTGDFLPNSEIRNFKLANIYFLVKDLSEAQFLDFEKTKTWLISTIENLPISEKHIRIALAAYSNDLRVEFKFSEYNKITEITSHIWSMLPKFKSPRNGRFNRAISKSIQYIFDNSEFRNDAITLMYIVSNSPNDDVFQLQNAIQENTMFGDSLKISTFYIGNKLSQPRYLKSIATSPESAYVIDSYDRLIYDTKDVIRKDIECQPAKLALSAEFATTDASVTNYYNSDFYGDYSNYAVYGTSITYMTGMTLPTQGTGNFLYQTTAVQMEAPTGFSINEARSIFTGSNKRVQLNWNPAENADFYEITVIRYDKRANLVDKSTLTTSSTSYVLQNQDLVAGFYHYLLLTTVTPEGAKSKPAKVNNQQEGWFFTPPEILKVSSSTGTASIYLTVDLEPGRYETIQARLINVANNFDQEFSFQYDQFIQNQQQIELTIEDGLIPTEAYTIELYTRQIYPFREEYELAYLESTQKYNLQVQLQDLPVVQSIIKYRDHKTIQIEYTPIEGASAYTLSGIDLSNQDLQLKNRRLGLNLIEFYDLPSGGQFKFQLVGIYGNKQSPLNEFTISTTPAPIEKLYITPSTNDILVKFDHTEGKSLEYQIKLLNSITNEVLHVVKIQSYTSLLEAILPAEPNTEYIIEATSHMPSLTSEPLRIATKTLELQDMSKVLVQTTLSNMIIKFKDPMEMNTNYKIEIYQPGDVAYLNNDVTQLLNQKIKPDLENFRQVLKIRDFNSENKIFEKITTASQVSLATQPDTFYVVNVSKATDTGSEGAQFTSHFIGLILTDLPAVENLKLIKLNDKTSRISKFYVKFEKDPQIENAKQLQNEFGTLLTTIVLKNSENGETVLNKQITNPEQTEVIINNVDDSNLNYLHVEIYTSRQNRHSQTKKSVTLNTNQQNFINIEQRNLLDMINQEMLNQYIETDKINSSQFSNLELIK